MGCDGINLLTNKLIGTCDHSRGGRAGSRALTGQRHQLCRPPFRNSEYSLAILGFVVLGSGE